MFPFLPSALWLAGLFPPCHCIAHTTRSRGDNIKLVWKYHTVCDCLRQETATNTDLAVSRSFVADLGNMSATAKSRQKLCSVSLPWTKSFRMSNPLFHVQICYQVYFCVWMKSCKSVSGQKVQGQSWHWTSDVKARINGDTSFISQAGGERKEETAPGSE